MHRHRVIFDGSNGIRHPRVHWQLVGGRLGGLGFVSLRVGGFVDWFAGRSVDRRMGGLGGWVTGRSVAWTGRLSGCVGWWLRGLGGRWLLVGGCWWVVVGWLFVGVYGRVGSWWAEWFRLFSSAGTSAVWCPAAPTWTSG